MTTFVSVLGGDIWNDHGVWRSNGLDGPGDASGVTLDRLRIVAASYLVETKELKDTFVLIAQGGAAPADRPSVASVIQRELIELGVPPSMIVLEEHSNSSYSQLLELQKIVLEKQPDRTSIISNEWHLPRLQTMLDTLDTLSSLRRVQPTFVAAEEVLVRTHPELWQEKVETVRARSDVLARIEKEQQGIAHIKEGTCRFR